MNALHKSRDVRSESIDVVQVLVDKHRHHVAGTALEHAIEEGSSFSFLEVQQLG